MAAARFDADAVFRALDKAGTGVLATDAVRSAFTQAGLPPAQVESLMLTFDQDGDGLITRNKFTRAVQSSGLANPSPTPTGTSTTATTTTAAAAASSTAGDTASDTSSVPSSPTRRTFRRPSSGSLDELFKALDLDGSGFLDQDEMRKALAAFGSSAEESEQIMAKVDTNGDGQISKEEFVEAARSSSLLPSASAPASASAAVSAGTTPEDGSKRRRTMSERRNRRLSGVRLPVKMQTWELAQTLFDECDYQETGSLDQHGLRMLVERLGVTTNLDNHVLKLMNAVDENGDGEVSRLEFETAWKTNAFQFLATLPGVSNIKRRRSMSVKTPAGEDVDAASVYETGEFSGSTESSEEDTYESTESAGGSKYTSPMRVSSPLPMGSPGLLPDSRHKQAVLTSPNFWNSRRSFDTGSSNPQQDYLRMIFAAADSRKRGYIGLNDLRSILEEEANHSARESGSLGGFQKSGGLSAKFTKRVMQHLDENGDGRITFDEFEQIFGGAGDHTQLLEAEKMAYLEETTELNEQLSRLQEENSEMTTAMVKKVSDLNSQLQQTQEMAQLEIDKALAEADTLRAENKTFKADMRKAKITVDGLEEQLQARDDQIAQLTDELDKLRSAELNVSSASRSYEEDMVVLEQRLEQAKAEREEMEAALHDDLKALESHAIYMCDLDTEMVGHVRELEDVESAKRYLLRFHHEMTAELTVLLEKARHNELQQLLPHLEANPIASRDLAPGHHKVEEEDEDEGMAELMKEAEQARADLLEFKEKTAAAWDVYRSRMHDAQTRHAEVELENNLLQQAIADERELMAKQLDALQDDKEKAQTELDEFMVKYRDLLMGIEDLDTDGHIVLLKAEVESLAAARRLLATQLKDQQRDADARERALEHDKQDLQAQLDILQESLVDAESQIDGAHSTLGELVKAELEAAAASHQAEIAGLEAQIAAAQQEHGDLKARLADAETKLTDASASLEAERSTAKSSSPPRPGPGESVLKGLRSSNEDLRGQLKKSRSEYMGAVQSLRSELLHKETELAKLRTTLAEKEAELAKLRLQLQAMAHKERDQVLIGELRDQLDAAQARVATLSAERDSALAQMQHSSLAELFPDHGRQRDFIAKVSGQEEITELKLTLTRLRDQLDRSEASFLTACQERDAALVQAVETRDASREAQDALMTRVQQAEEQHSEQLEVVRRERDAANADLQAEIELLKHALRDLESQLSTTANEEDPTVALKAALAQARKEHAARITTFEMEAEATQARYETSLDSLEQQVNELQEERVELQDRVDHLLSQQTGGDEDDNRERALAPTQVVEVQRVDETSIALLEARVAELEAELRAQAARSTAAEADFARTIHGLQEERGELEERIARLQAAQRAAGTPSPTERRYSALDEEDRLATELQSLLDEAEAALHVRTAEHAASMRTVEDRVTELEEEVTELRTETTRSKGAELDMQLVVRDLQEERDELLERIAHLQEAQRAVGTPSPTERRYSALDEEDRLATDLQTLLDEAEVALHARTAEHAASMRTVEARVTELEEEVTELRERLAEAQRGAGGDDDDYEFQRMKQRYADLQRASEDKVEMLEERIVTLIEERDAREAEATSTTHSREFVLRSPDVSADEDLNLTARYSEMHAALSSVENDAHNSDGDDVAEPGSAQLAALEAELADARAALVARRRMVEDQMVQIHSLRAASRDGSEASKLIESLTMRCDEAVAQSQALRTAVGQRDVLVGEVRRQNEAQSAAIGDLKAQIHALEEQMAHTPRSGGPLETQVRDLEAELAAREAARAALAEEVRRLDDELAAARKLHSDSELTVERSVMERSFQSDELQALQGEKAAREADVVAAKHTIEQLEAQLAATTEALRKAEADKAETVRELESVRRVLTEVDATMAGLQQQRRLDMQQQNERLLQATGAAGETQTRVRELQAQLRAQLDRLDDAEARAARVAGLEALLAEREAALATAKAKALELAEKAAALERAGAEQNAAVRGLEERLAREAAEAKAREQRAAAEAQRLAEEHREAGSRSAKELQAAQALAEQLRDEKRRDEQAVRREVEAMLAQLQQERANGVHSQQRLAAERAAVEARAESLKEEVRVLDQTVARLREQLRQTRDGLEREMEQLRTARAEEKAQHGAAQIALRGEVDELARQLDSTSREAHAIGRERDAHARESEALAGHTEELMGMMRALQRQVRDSEQHILAAQQNYSGSLGSLQQQNRSLSSAVDDARQSLARQSQDVQRAFEVLEGQLRHAQQLSDQKQTDMERARQALQAELVTAQRDMHALRLAASEQTQVASNQLQTLSASLARAEREVASLRSSHELEIARYENELRSAREMLRVLQESLSRATSAASSPRKIGLDTSSAMSSPRGFEQAGRGAAQDSSSSRAFELESRLMRSTVTVQDLENRLDAARETTDAQAAKISELRNQVQLMDSELWRERRRRTDEVEQLREVMEADAAGLDEMRRHMADLVARVEDDDRRMARAAATQRQAAEDLARAQQEVRRLSLDSSARSGGADHVAALEEELARLEAENYRLRTSTTTTTIVEEERGDVPAKTRRDSAQLNALEAEIAVLRDQLEWARNTAVGAGSGDAEEMEELRQTLRALEEQLRLLTAENHRLRASKTTVVEETRAGARRDSAQLNDLEAENAVLRDQLEWARNGAGANDSGETDELRRKLRALEEQLACLDAENHRLRTAKTTTTVVEEERSDVPAKTRRDSAQLNDLEAENAVLRDQLEWARDAANSEGSPGELDLHLRGLEEQLSLLRGENDRLRRARTTTVVEERRARSASPSRTPAARRDSTQLNDLEAENAVLRDQLEWARNGAGANDSGEMDELRRTLRALEEQLARLDAENHRLRTSKTTTTVVEEERSDAPAKTRRDSAQLNALEAENALLRDRLQWAQEQSGAEHGRTKTVHVLEQQDIDSKAEIKHLRAENDILRSRLAFREEAAAPAAAPAATSSKTTVVEKEVFRARPEDGILIGDLRADVADYDQALRLMQEKHEAIVGSMENQVSRYSKLLEEERGERDAERRGLVKELTARQDIFDATVEHIRETQSSVLRDQVVPRSEHEEIVEALAHRVEQAEARNGSAETTHFAEVGLLKVRVQELQSRNEELAASHQGEYGALRTELDGLRGDVSHLRSDNLTLTNERMQLLNDLEQAERSLVELNGRLQDAASAAASSDAQLAQERANTRRLEARLTEAAVEIERLLDELRRLRQGAGADQTNLQARVRGLEAELKQQRRDGDEADQAHNRDLARLRHENELLQERNTQQASELLRSQRSHQEAEGSAKRLRAEQRFLESEVARLRSNNREHAPTTIPRSFAGRTTTTTTATTTATKPSPAASPKAVHRVPRATSPRPRPAKQPQPFGFTEVIVEKRSYVDTSAPMSVHSRSRSRSPARPTPRSPMFHATGPNTAAVQETVVERTGHWHEEQAYEHQRAAPASPRTLRKHYAPRQQHYVFDKPQTLTPETVAEMTVSAPRAEPPSPQPKRPHYFSEQRLQHYAFERTATGPNLPY